jgi:hypothetical protein
LYFETDPLKRGCPVISSRPCRVQSIFRKHALQNTYSARKKSTTHARVNSVLRSSCVVRPDEPRESPRRDRGWPWHPISFSPHRSHPCFILPQRRLGNPQNKVANQPMRCPLVRSGGLIFPRLAERQPDQQAPYWAGYRIRGPPCARVAISHAGRQTHRTPSRRVSALIVIILPAGQNRRPTRSW